MEEQELIQILNKLPEGIYRCIREKDRDDFSANKLNEKEIFVFSKDESYTYPFSIIGSDLIYDSKELVKNSYNEFSPLKDIKLIS